MPATSVSTKYIVLGSLYFSQGLPFGFFTQVLPVILRQEHLSLAAIGLSSLLAAPWAFKFLWAPALDRWSSPRVGHRRSWILPLQAASIALMGSIALLIDDMSIPTIMVTVVTINLLAATQDIATDGLAVDMLRPEQRGFANGLQVAGYRIGMLVGGGAVLIVYDRIGGPWVFATMAGLLAVATIPIIFAREPVQTTRAAAPTPSPWAFARRPGAGPVLLLLIAYKFGDAFGTAMLRPFLVDLGLSIGELGWLLGTVGFIAGLAGALVGGLLVKPLGRARSLLIFAGLQTLALLGYAYLAADHASSTALYLCCAVEHFTGALATVALFTCMMDWCSSGTAAADYTVQASTVVIATGAASAIAGLSAEALGYAAHFALAAALTLAALPLILNPRLPRPPQVG